jgi:hypothetical protein
MRNSNQRHLFVAGLHRSGTSLLHRSLRAHHRISGFENTGVPEDEGQHLQSVFPAAAHFGGPGKFCFAEEAALHECSPCVTEENREKLLREWGRHWDVTQPVLLEKSPPNLIRMRFLQAMFPNSLFLIVVRHPLAQSYATQKWSNTDIAELVEHWRVAHRRMLADLPFVNHWRLVRYEDFVEDPEPNMTDLFGWLGVESRAVSESVKSNVNERYFARWEKEMPGRPLTARRLRADQALANQFGYHFERPYTRAVPWESKAVSADLQCMTDGNFSGHPVSRAVAREWAAGQF